MRSYRLKILSLTFIVVSFTYLLFAEAKNNLSIIVKFDDSLPIKSKITTLAGQMRQTAKIYKTTNQKAYWESEGKRTILNLLKSEGYYDGIVDSEIPEENNSIVFYIDSGKRYVVSNLQVKHAKNSNKQIKLPDIAELTIKKGDDAIAAEILDVEQDILERIEAGNCLLNLHVNHKVFINHLNRSLDVTYIVDAGEIAYIKSIELSGLKTVKEDYVRKILPLKKGQCFRRSDIIKAQGELQRSSLFSSTSPDIPDKTEDGAVPVKFNLEERKHRSVKAGVSFATDLGLGAKFGWEHRNFFSNGELINTNLFVNQKEQALNLNYTHPFYKADNQTLKLGASLENKKLPAFLSKELELFAGVERKISEIWKWGFGGKYSFAEVKRPNDSRKYFSFVSIPTFITHDKRDNIFDPHKGYQLKLEGAPFFALNKEGKSFAKGRIHGSTYFSFKSKFDPVIALRASTGTISAIEEAKIPATEKFYVGGGSSVRGYAHQLVGPLDSSNRPLGGRSFVETSVECRVRVSEDFGVVAFLDSGNSYKSSYPVSGKLLHGAGIGVRYYTDFAPIRVDVGFPLNPRKDVDRKFQLYFSIGQSF